MAHITEDGRCSHCGWPGPDWDEAEAALIALGCVVTGQEG